MKIDTYFRKLLPLTLLSLMSPVITHANTVPANSDHYETATFGGGCFWCLDAAYRQLDGVHSVESGYMGGTVDHPTYAQVCSGNSGHAEVVQIKYDPETVSYNKLLDMFWNLHDPTQLNRQGNDIGTQYRSVIFYHTPKQEREAKQSLKEQQKSWNKPIVTIIEGAHRFWKAEESHQDYYFRNKGKNPYCNVVIKPKLQKANLRN